MKMQTNSLDKLINAARQLERQKVMLELSLDEIDKTIENLPVDKRQEFTKRARALREQLK